MRRTTYQPGTLRTALIEAATVLIAERGVEALSVSELTRRLGICSSAPYRHFAGRQDLLLATAAQAGRELATLMTQAVQEVHRRSGAAGGAAAALAATAAAYATFVAQRRAGLDFVFADDLGRLGCTELADARRSVIDVLLPLTTAITHDHADALHLMDRCLAAAHGLGILFRGGFGRHRIEDLAALRREAAGLAHTLATAAGDLDGQPLLVTRGCDLLGARSAHALAGASTPSR